MELLKSFCNLGSLLTCDQIQIMQMGYTLFYLVCMCIISNNIVQLGKSPSKLMQTMNFSTIIIFSISSAGYDVWQISYIVKLLIDNIKLLSLTQSSSINPNKSETETTKSLLNPNLKSILNGIVNSCMIAFILLISAIIVMVSGQITYKIEMKETDLYIVFDILVSILASWHLISICIVFKQVQKLCLVSVSSFKNNSNSKVVVDSGV
jgi:hypothetical protein